MNEIETADNPRAVIGANDPPKPVPEAVAEWLKDHFKELSQEVTEVLVRARALANPVTCEADVEAYGLVVKDLRDIVKRLAATHGAEKAPYWRTSQVVDQYFFPLWEKLEQRTKTAKPATLEILVGRVNKYNQDRLAAEQARRDAEERAAREEENRLRQEAEAREAEAREAEQKAARARNEDNRRAAEAVAEAAQQEADRLRVQQDAARSTRIDAQAAAAAKPADKVRERHGGGVLNTMKQVPYVEMTDKMKLDWTKLAPFIKDDAVLSALKAWAKSTNHKTSMTGAIIEMRNETDLR